ncbi:50S ribosomal protein L27 [Candidatus Woesebacteria bacterium]|jgi:large subunit ribosomal protein L27|nr:50S ribosomal protein L27 [Candidatus Woesebacteria bacterium]HNV45276.1 50S ribosomal protein L27 [Candidatus Woesebacteria bacterium]HOA12304.1 50S ribosomal protein L27 [Candidatus Woesebacteria bacterium]HOC07502.1 50S ribosomal protein L27 [Candidatus Woesebacteria bacterium]HOI05393.1 50S ribosomal protein L27 [Candidatus Woesebacteria bacterium]
MAHVKGSGSVTQHSQGARHGRRFGLKKFGGENIQVGQIILRQKGAKYKAGAGTKLGKDYTIFAMVDGVVDFTKHFGKTVVKVIAKS